MQTPLLQLSRLACASMIFLQLAAAAQTVLALPVKLPANPRWVCDTVCVCVPIFLWVRALLVCDTGVMLQESVG